MVQSRGQKVFSAANGLLMLLVAAAALFPFLHEISKSVSNEAAVMAGDVSLIPIGFNLRTYQVVLGTYDFWHSLLVSVYITVMGTVLQILVLSLAAYPLSRRVFPGKRVFTFLFAFTMLFGGGLIPTYLVVKSLGLLNRFWALILPGVVSVFNLVILRNYFMTIPDSLEDSARIDGCANIVVFARIIFPLSLPAVATIAVYCAVGYWNSYFGALIYLNSKTMQPLSLYLRTMVMEADSQLVNLNPELANLNPESLRSATVVAATLPILLVYPFLQRFFVKGAIVGAVKE
jgi:putative aldouronate transport system permease protein